MRSATLAGGRLDPPLAEGWRVTGCTADVAPAFDGTHVIAAGGGELSALDPADGRRVWRTSIRGDATNLAVAAQFILISTQGPDGSGLTCVDAAGAVVWQQSGWSITQDALGSEKDGFLVLGVSDAEPGLRCHVLAPATGQRRHSFACPAASVPDWTASGYVYSVRSDDPDLSGLFFYEAAGGTPVRLLADSHAIRTTVDLVALIDTTDVDRMPGELIAFDLAAQKRQWTAVGGVNMTIAVDRGQVAAVTSLRGKSLALTLYDLASGRTLWRADPVEGRHAAPLLAADWAGVSVNGRTLHLYDRTNGRQLQSIDARSLFPEGPRITPFGLILSDGDDVVCLRSS